MSTEISYGSPPPPGYGWLTPPSLAEITQFVVTTPVQSGSCAAHADCATASAATTAAPRTRRREDPIPARTMAPAPDGDKV